MTTNRNVYICLSNNSSANSTVEPSGKNLSANGNIQTADGYLWKYLYNIKPTNKFLSNTWIPVPTSTAKLDYDTTSIIAVDGELCHLILTSNGSGYVHSNIFVTSFTTGCTILTVANTTNLAATPNRALIVGSDARIEIDRTFYNPTTWRIINHKDEVIGGSDKRYVGHGLREEAIEFARCFRAGEKESPMLPLDETLSIMGTITEIANQIGLKFEKFAQ